MKGDPVEESDQFYEEEHDVPSDVLTTKEGNNAFEWNMRYPGAEDIDGRQILWAGSTAGPRAIPGTYRVQLLIDDKVVGTQDFELTKDPRIETTQEDFQAQFDLHQVITAKLDTTHKTINRIRDVRAQINDVKSDNPDDTEIQERADAVLEVLEDVEGELMQTKAESYQDVLNFPIKLNNKLASLASTVATGDGRPTQQQYEVYEDLSAQIDEQFERINQVFEGELPDEIREIEQRSIRLN